MLDGHDLTWDRTADIIQWVRMIAKLLLALASTVILNPSVYDGRWEPLNYLYTLSGQV
jgi:hypothetical protein